MNELIAVEKMAQWQKLKMLVLDSRLLTDYETREPHGPGRVHGLVPAGAAAGFIKATASA
jgi:hypothetical protein